MQAKVKGTYTVLAGAIEIVYSIFDVGCSSLFDSRDAWTGMSFDGQVDRLCIDLQ